ncbi:MAG: flagellar filament capping protein FliD [Acidobacteriaceae bacterium]|nr:flagellar filament capping protein FliD [Acidobacteriaceae bacterium]
MGTSSSTTVFNGNSTYAAQLQRVITTAVGRASAPIQQLQTHQSTLATQENELQTLSSRFQSLQTALDSINNLTGVGTLSASVSDSSILAAATSSGAMAGNYTITVSNIGTQTSTISDNGLTIVTDPSSGNIDASATYTLSVKGQQYAISDPSGSLNGLAQAINASGASVQATVVNVGGSSTPDYRLSVQSTQYAPDSIQLSDGSNSLMNTLSSGSYVTYQVNGQPATPINSTSRTITVSPGLTANLLQRGTASISVAENAGTISGALSSFVSAYNAAAAELEKNRGQNGGALSGESIVYELQGALETLASYTTGTGALGSLSDLGLTFDQSGNIQFDSSVFASVAATAPSDILNFLGSETGGGFLQSAANLLASVNDSTSGMLAEGTQSINDEISNIATQINNDQAKVTELQQSLTTQMASADATIASLQNQVTEVTTLFTDMQQAYKQSNG